MTHALTALAIAAQAGIDLGLIKDNLRLSYEERVLKHQEALNRVLAAERARRERRKRRARLATRWLQATRKAPHQN